MTRINIVIAARLALAVTLPTVSAQAQSPRTFVSAAGIDSNPCSFASPCRHFQAAVTATSAGGEVDALDPAGYGPITISQAITIEGQGWSYIAPPAGGNAITINAVSGNDKITIHGVSLNGVGITGPTNGIQFNSGGSLTVRDSVIRNFSVNGILFQPNNSGPQGRLYVLNTVVSDNGNNGIAVIPAIGIPVIAAFNNVESINNGAGGFELTGPGSSALDVTILYSLAANNGGNGITAGMSDVDIRNTVVVGNQNGVSSNPGATVILSNSFLSRNSPTNALLNGGFIATYGTNICEPNTCSQNTAPPGAPF